MKFKWIIFTFILVGLLAFLGCNKESDNDMANLTIGVTDATIEDAEHVIVTFTKIELNMEGDEDNWITYYENSTGTAIDLLEFRNGNVSLFDTKTLPEGKYDQIRLFLSDKEGANTITLKGNPTPINLNLTQSISKTGLKIVSGFEIYNGIENKLTIDFDVRKSIVVKEVGKTEKYVLKPTVRVVSNIVSGKIEVTNATAAGIYYLYDAGYDITSEAAFEGQVVDEQGNITNEPMPFYNAVSSDIAEDENGVVKALFAYIPFGKYDVYYYDINSPGSLKSIAASVEISADTPLITVE